MTTEEKAKRFDEVVDEFRGLLEGVHEDKCDIMEEDILKIVPELKKESEDEKVKRILHSISSKMSFHLPDIFTEEEFQCFDTWSNAWLERQGRKESDPRYENLEELLAADDIYQMAMNDAMVNEAKEKAVNALSEMCIWRLLGLEKQGKSKFEQCIQDGDKIVTNEDGTHFNISQLERVAKKEPKFKVGDWIIRSAEGFKRNTYLIKEIKDYYVCEDLKGRRVTFTFNDVHNNFKLWNISDAKDGDVLASNNGNTFIYHKHDNNYVYYHCSINYFDNITINSSWNVLGIKPATQEQRDLLFQKMKEAGYEWDDEKKEVKKIHVIDEGKAEMDYCFTKMMNGEKINPAWSEDDERMCNASIRACQYMIENFENSTRDYEDAIDWLKSLKDRYSWKPSKEQMKGIDCAIKTLRHQLNVEDKRLNSLYEQLKKL